MKLKDKLFKKRIRRATKEGKMIYSLLYIFGTLYTNTIIFFLFMGQFGLGFAFGVLTTFFVLIFDIHFIDKITKKEVYEENEWKEVEGFLFES